LCFSFINVAALQALHLGHYDSFRASIEDSLLTVNYIFRYP